ncbi:hypothetical protein Tco_0657868 [Tanacetum coccineum]
MFELRYVVSGGAKECVLLSQVLGNVVEGVGRWEEEGEVVVDEGCGGWELEEKMVEWGASIGGQQGRGVKGWKWRSRGTVDGMYALMFFMVIVWEALEVMGSCVGRGCFGYYGRGFGLKNWMNWICMFEDGD